MNIVDLSIVTESIDYGYTTSASFSGVGPKFLRITDIQDGRVNWDKVPYCLEAPSDNFRYALVNDDILFARTGATTGKSFLIQNFEGNACFASYLIRVRPSKQVNALYLSYFFKTNIYWQQIWKDSVGAAQPSVNGTKLKRLKIPLPPLETQKKIALVLDKADKIRQKRKKALLKMDELIQSVFLDMFGECFDNEADFVTIDKVVSFIDYRGKTPERIDAGIPFINAKCVKQGYFCDTKIDYIGEETYKSVMTRGYPKPGDVLFTTEGATMGYTCRIPKKFTNFSVGQRLITLQCKNEINSTYLEFTLNHPLIQAAIFSKATGSAVKGIRGAKFAKVLIPLPPANLQSQFYNFEKKFSLIRENCVENFEVSNNLFNSLLQKAFKGELDFNEDYIQKFLESEE